MNFLSAPWTVQGLVDFAESLGLIGSKLDAQRVKFHLPSNTSGLFIFRLTSKHQGFCAELVISRRDERTESLLEQIQQRYETIGEDYSNPLVCIGLTDFDPLVLQNIREWVERYISNSTVNTRSGTRALLKSQDTSSLSKWMSVFMATRGLARPDDRPLYAYKTTDEEFGKIAKQLSLVASFRGTEIFRKDQKYDALFVLFAAEWWRREYRGGHWSWEPVFKAMGLDDADRQHLRMSPQQLLYPALERGFKWWRREIFITDAGRAFIGTIAAEGGLPLNLLTDPYGGLKRYFKHLLERYLPLRATGIPAMQVAEELKADLPVSFRNPTVYRVAGDIICATLDLRAEYGLAGVDDPLSHLDRVDSAWRDRFPLVLESEPAKALMRALVADAAAQTDTGQPLIVTRSLIPLTERHWRLEARVALPRKLSQLSLASLFGELGQWPAQAEIWLLVPFSVRLAVLSKIDAAHYRVRSEGVVWHGEQASHEVMISLYSYGKPISERRPLPDSLLEPTLPWIFTENEGHLINLGQGGMRLGTEDVTITLPGGFELHGDEQAPKELGELEGVGHQLFRGSGRLEARCNDGIFVIHTRESRAEMPRYELVGQRLFYDSNVRQVFRCMPRLSCRETSGAPYTDPSALLQWRHRGSKESWQRSTKQVQGVINLKASKGDELVFLGCVAVLPAATELKLLPGSDSHNGKVRFSGLPGVRFATETNGVAIVSQVDDDVDGVLLSIRCKNPQRARFDLQLQWPDQPRALTLRLPVPVAGAKFRGPDDDWLANGTSITLEELPGVHAVGFGMTDRLILDMEVRAQDFGTQELRGFSNQVSLPKIGDGYDLPLIQLRDRFRQIFTLSEDLDCEIRLTLVGTREYARLRIFRYSYQLKAENGWVAIHHAYDRSMAAIDCAEALQLELHSLSSPGEPGQILEAIRSEGVHTGQWQLPGGLAPGPWLAMPTPDQDHSVRPVFVPVAGDMLSGDGGLGDAIAITQTDQRSARIADCIEQMTKDYAHSDWKLVTDSLLAFRHLPATSLDLWDGFARNPRAMAMLLVVADQNNSEQVLRLAEELPFSWELVSFDDWLMALSLVKRFMEHNAPDCIAQALVESAVEQKLELMREADPVLDKMIVVLRERLLNKSEQDLKHASLLAVTGGIDKLIESAAAKMRSQHGIDEKWPQFDGFLFEDLEWAASEDVRTLFVQQAWYMESVLKAPVAMAFRACAMPPEQRSEPTKIELYQLRRIQDFAPEWYREAFGLTTLYLYATDALYESGVSE